MLDYCNITVLENYILITLVIMTIINVAAHGVFDCQFLKKDKVQKTFQVPKYYPIQITQISSLLPQNHFHL